MVEQMSPGYGNRIQLSEGSKERVNLLPAALRDIKKLRNLTLRLTFFRRRGEMSKNKKEMHAEEVLPESVAIPATSTEKPGASTHRAIQKADCKGGFLLKFCLMPSTSRNSTASTYICTECTAGWAPDSAGQFHLTCPRVHVRSREKVL